MTITERSGPTPKAIQVLRFSSQLDGGNPAPSEAVWLPEGKAPHDHWVEAARLFSLREPHADMVATGTEGRLAAGVDTACLAFPRFGAIAILKVRLDESE